MQYAIFGIYKNDASMDRGSFDGFLDEHFYLSKRKAEAICKKLSKHDHLDEYSYLNHEVREVKIQDLGE